MTLPPQGTAAENHAFLRRRFCDRLLAQTPASVLDVGCGEGFVLDACARVGVFAVGVDTQPRHSHPHDRVLAAAATALPFADRSFDLVCLRHILHHLLDPLEALREALRVCQRGLLVAEPWFCDDLYGQANARWADLWLKACHRAEGRIHQPALSPSWLCSALTQLGMQVEGETQLRLRSRSKEDLDHEIESWAPSSPEPESLHRLQAAVRQRGLSFPGSVILQARFLPQKPQATGS